MDGRAPCRLTMCTRYAFSSDALDESGKESKADDADAVDTLDAENDNDAAGSADAASAGDRVGAGDAIAAAGKTVEDDDDGR